MDETTVLKSLSQIATDFIVQNINEYREKYKDYIIPPVLSNKIFSKLVSLIDGHQIKETTNEFILQFIENDWKVQNIELWHFDPLALDVLFKLVKQNHIAKFSIIFHVDQRHLIKPEDFYKLITDIIEKKTLKHLCLNYIPYCFENNENLKIILAKKTFPLLKYLDLSNTPFWCWQVDANNVPEIETLVLENVPPEQKNMEPELKRIKIEKSSPINLFDLFCISKMSNTLTSLVLHNTIINETDMETIFSLRGLRDLDLSWFNRNWYDKNSDVPEPGVRPAKYNLFTILSRLPKLQSLDISGTVYADFLFRDGLRTSPHPLKRRVTVPQGWDRKPLDCLGVWMTKAYQMVGFDVIAKHVFCGDNDETLLLAIQKYQHRLDPLKEMWNSMDDLQDFNYDHLLQPINPTQIVVAALDSVHRWDFNSSIVHACYGAFYYMFLVHTPIPSFLKRRVLETLCMYLQKEKNDTDAKETCLRTLNVILYFAEDFEPNLKNQILNQISANMLQVLKNSEDDEIITEALEVLGKLVKSKNKDLKKHIYSMSFVHELLEFLSATIKRSKDTGNDNTAFDPYRIEIVKTGWSLLWNLTVVPEFATKFIEFNALQLWMNCFEPYNDRTIYNFYSLRHVMLGTLAKLSETASFRPLMTNFKFMEILFNNLNEIDEYGRLKVRYFTGKCLAFIINDDDLSLDDDLRNEATEKLCSFFLSCISEDDIAKNTTTFMPIIALFKASSKSLTRMLLLLWFSKIKSFEQEPEDQVIEVEAQACELFIKNGGFATLKSLLESDKIVNEVFKKNFADYI